ESFPQGIHIRINKKILFKHLVESVKNRCIEKQTNIAMIPGSLN
ncbi:43_t:CDS:2, partial [Funneliformis geosporum]